MPLVFGPWNRDVRSFVYLAFWASNGRYPSKALQQQQTIKPPKGRPNKNKKSESGAETLQRKNNLKGTNKKTQPCPHPTTRTNYVNINYKPMNSNFSSSTKPLNGGNESCFGRDTVDGAVRGPELRGALALLEEAAGLSVFGHMGIVCGCLYKLGPFY